MFKSLAVILVLLARDLILYHITNWKPTWKICLREKRARRSSRPSLFSNFSATDKQHATIYYNNTMRTIPPSWARARIVERVQTDVTDAEAPFCEEPRFQITVLKARCRNEEAAFTMTTFSIPTILCARASVLLILYKLPREIILNPLSIQQDWEFLLPNIYFSIMYERGKKSELMERGIDTG